MHNLPNELVWVVGKAGIGEIKIETLLRAATDREFLSLAYGILKMNSLYNIYCHVKIGRKLNIRRYIDYLTF